MNNNINLSLINKTNTLIYVMPLDDRQNEIGFSYDKLSLDWNLISFEKTLMMIQLNFSNPSYISPSSLLDNIVFVLNGS